MKLKTASRAPALARAARAIWQSRARRYWAIWLYTCLLFYGGYAFHKSGNTFNPPVHGLQWAVRKLRTTFAPPPVEHLTLDIKQEDLMNLEEQRATALAAGVLIVGDDDFVPATVTHNGQSVRVELRLKGDWLDHLQGDKWSFRIKVKGDQTLLGMRDFAIQHPMTRNYIYEWMYFKALQREGLIALRYQFVQVTINGKDMGVYALEEHFDKRLIENNRLREGPIIRFDEDLYWMEMAQQEFAFPGAQINGAGSYRSSTIDSFQTGQILSDPVSSAQYNNAVSLLEGYRQGDLTRSQVFDVPKLARFYAITDLMGAEHGLYWHNERFYYNPITARLEPIAFDGAAGRTTPGLGGLMPYLADGPELYSDLGFIAQYTQALERVSNPAYLDTLLADLEPELQQNLELLYTEFPEFEYSLDVLHANQRYIQSTLNPVQGLHAYLAGVSGNQIGLQVGNIQSMPLQIVSIAYQGRIVFQPAQPIVLLGKLDTENVAYQDLSFPLPAGLTFTQAQATDMTVNFTLLGSSRIARQAVYLWPRPDNALAQESLARQTPNVDQFAFLTVDEAAQRIVIQPGTWRLDRNLVLPAGYRVQAGEGTQLDLSNGAAIFSYSPLDFLGTSDDPVVIRSSDGTGQGLVVLNAGDISFLQNVLFHNLANPSQNGWEVTGAVTFYESPVAITYSQFADNRSEDALNVVRSAFTIDHSRFDRIFADAIDGDFITGQIADTTFTAIGNDAIDVSGSQVDIQRVIVDGAGDKGLSAGEDSQVTFTAVGINNAAIAVASKDTSEITGHYLGVVGGSVGVTAYQKKSEYGPGAVNIEHLTMDNVEVPYLVEVHSTVIANGQAIPADREHVADLLYGAEYGKSSD